MRPNRSAPIDRVRGIGRRRPVRRGRRYDTRHTPDEAVAESTEPVVVDAAPEEEPLGEPAEAAAPAEEDEPPMRSKHSRPPAPAFAFGGRPELTESGEVDAVADSAEEDAVGTELDLESEEEGATSTERLVTREADEVLPVSEPPLGERETMPAIPGKLGPDTPRDAGWLRSAPSTRSAEEAARDEQESFPPVVEELEDRAEEDGPTEEQLRRRGRLRRFVAVAVVAALALTVGLVAFASLSPEVSYAQRQGVASAARLTQQAVADARAKARKPKQVEAPPVVEEKSDALGDDFDGIGKETVRLLNAREFEKASALARRLIELKPASAFGYRCLGSALQDLGRDAEAREVYSECATNATKGEVYECSALGGRKKPAN
jgi:hypothetical protein